MTTESTRTLAAPARDAAGPERRRLPLVVYVLALGTFLMLTTEFVVAGILPEVAADLRIPLAQAGSLITVFAVGMIIGAPLMALLTMHMSARLTLIVAMLVFVAGHIVVALASDLAVLLGARFVTAFATGAFWSVSAVVATRAAGTAAGARALGIVTAGGALATVLGVPIGAFIAQATGWRGTFWFLAVAAAMATFFVARLVPAHDGSAPATSLKTELAGLRSRRLWLALLACATTTGGVLAAYSYIAPILSEQAGVSASAIPLVLTGFGVGSLIGTILGGRFGDDRPGLVTVLTPAVTIAILAGISISTGEPAMMIVLVVLLGLFGLSANGVLIHLAVRASGHAATLGSALAVSAFNVGTAVGSALAGAALSSPLGIHGPATIGTVIVALTLIPTIALAVLRRRDA
ncbi:MULTISPECIES: MFS transporter [unclassified Microbacterium]|uniref:MFS transporter n=1 Tax=unclassified Microbacterium TaxID=2609290 RepID=UPI001604C1E5|nr:MULTISPECIES: MFS transporter [unclassified Microbacterium]QNA91867.1 MFS transporter [Microbacterium sp. Se63.02b]QYM65089.1 MFS transporter [Microbacterium sp. Se5.02b]